MTEFAEEQLFYIICMIAAIFLVFCAFYFAKRFRKSHLAGKIDEMDGIAFERFCAKLLEQNGFCEVKLTPPSGDFGADILAKKEGVTYAIQCKRYAEAVGVRAVLEIYAAKDYYDKMVGAVLTNQYFTAPAIKAAKKLQILLWDREYLESMLEE